MCYIVVTAENKNRRKRSALSKTNRYGTRPPATAAIMTTDIIVAHTSRGRNRTETADRFREGDVVHTSRVTYAIRGRAVYYYTSISGATRIRIVVVQ